MAIAATLACASSRTSPANVWPLSWRTSKEPLSYTLSWADIPAADPRESSLALELELSCPMTVRELAAITLEARRLPVASPVPGPQATAFDRLGPLGTVLFILRPPNEPQRALFGVYERTEEEWLERALFGSPWPGVPTAGLLNGLGLATSHIDGRECFVYTGATAFADVVLEIEVDGERRTVEIQPTTSCFIAMGLWHPGVEHTLHARARHGGRLEEHAISSTP